MKRGTLSTEIKEALGMPEGAGAPPLLVNMQTYGTPLSPHLKIPGLNHLLQLVLDAGTILVVEESLLLSACRCV